MTPIVRPTIAGLRADGFTDGSGVSVDIDIVERMACHHCGRRTCKYVPLRKGLDYRPFAQCKKCGYEHEL